MISSNLERTTKMVNTLKMRTITISFLIHLIFLKLSSPLNSTIRANIFLIKSLLATKKCSRWLMIYSYKQQVSYPLNKLHQKKGFRILRIKTNLDLKIPMLILSLNKEFLIQALIRIWKNCKWPIISIKIGHLSEMSHMGLVSARILRLLRLKTVPMSILSLKKEILIQALINMRKRSKRLIISIIRIPVTIYQRTNHNGSFLCVEYWTNQREV